jgi:hypothetical protein
MQQVKYCIICTCCSSCLSLSYIRQVLYELLYIIRVWSPPWKTAVMRRNFASQLATALPAGVCVFQTPGFLIEVYSSNLIKQTTGKQSCFVVQILISNSFLGLHMCLLTEGFPQPPRKIMNSQNLLALTSASDLWNRLAFQRPILPLSSGFWYDYTQRGRGYRVIWEPWWWRHKSGVAVSPRLYWILSPWKLKIFKRLS